MKFSSDMLFTHPVLTSTSSDFRNALFDASFEVSTSDANLDLSVSLELRCQDLAQLLAEGYAGSGFYLVCPSTYTNRLVEMAPGTRPFRFNARDFFGTVMLRPVIWSKRAKRGWCSDYLHPEYGGCADIPAAAVLAVGDEHIFSIDRERLRPFESIFKLAARADLSPGVLAADTDADKITIQAHPDTKDLIEGFRNSGPGRSVLLNAVYLPVVMQVLSDVASDRSTCENHQWFRVFEAKAAALGINLDAPELLSDAERLLDTPFKSIERDKERLLP